MYLAVKHVADDLGPAEDLGQGAVTVVQEGFGLFEGVR